MVAFYTILVERSPGQENQLMALAARARDLPRSLTRVHLQSRLLTSWANQVMNRVERAQKAPDSKPTEAAVRLDINDDFFRRVAEVRQLKELVQDADGQGLCWNLEGRAHEALGAWDAALMGMKENLSVCAGSGLDHRLSKAHNDVARVLCKRGAPSDLLDALRHVDQARCHALRLDQTTNLAFAFHQRLQLWIAANGQLELAPGVEWGPTERALVEDDCLRLEAEKRWSPRGQIGDAVQVLRYLGREEVWFEMWLTG